MAYESLIALGIGVAYGYMKKGRQDKVALFKTGAIWGLIMALVFAALSYFVPQSGLGVGGTFIGLALWFIVLVALFVGGVWVGDWLEHRGKTAA